jgi:hypothetical protein
MNRIKKTNTNLPNLSSVIDNLSDEFRFEVYGEFMFGFDEKNKGCIHYEKSKYDNSFSIGFVCYIGTDTKQGKVYNDSALRSREYEIKNNRITNIPENIEKYKYEVEFLFRSKREYFLTKKDMVNYINSIENIEQIISRKVEENELCKTFLYERGQTIRNAIKLTEENRYFDKTPCKCCGKEVNVLHSKPENKPVGTKVYCDYICGLADTKGVSREEAKEYFNLKEDNFEC